MGLFSKKKKKQEEKPVEKKKEPKFGPNNLISLKPVVTMEESIYVLKKNIDSIDFKNQTANLGSKKAANAFLQGYNYALLILTTSDEIEKFNNAYVTFKDLSKEAQEYLNKLNKEDFE